LRILRDQLPDRGRTQLIANFTPVNKFVLVRDS
jgi:hypothetical protein